MLHYKPPIFRCSAQSSKYPNLPSSNEYTKTRQFWLLTISKQPNNRGTTCNQKWCTDRKLINCRSGFSWGFCFCTTNNTALLFHCTEKSSRLMLLHESKHKNAASKKKSLSRLYSVLALVNRLLSEMELKEMRARKPNESAERRTIRFGVDCANLAKSSRTTNECERRKTIAALLLLKACNFSQVSVLRVLF